MAKEDWTVTEIDGEFHVTNTVTNEFVRTTDEATVKELVGGKAKETDTPKR